MDLLTGSQDAFFAALNTAVGGAWPVYTTVPENAQPPFTLIGKVFGAVEDEKGGDLEKFNVEIQNIYRGRDRRVLLQMMNTCRVAITPRDGEEGQALAADGIDFGGLRLVSEGASDAGLDGVTYAGLTTFEFYAEPA